MESLVQVKVFHNIWFWRCLTWTFPRIFMPQIVCNVLFFRASTTWNLLILFWARLSLIFLILELGNICVVGMVRRERCILFCYFGTAYYPAQSMILWFLGHNSKLPCHYCWKTTERIESIFSSSLLPTSSADVRIAVLDDDGVSIAHCLRIECCNRKCSDKVPLAQRRA